MKNIKITPQSILSLLLSAALLLNSAAPALAQLHNPKKTYNFALPSTTAVRDNVVDTQMERQVALREEVEKQLRGKLNENQQQRLENIRQMFFPVGLSNEKEKTDREHFADLYQSHVKSSYDHQVSELKKQQRKHEKQLEEEVSDLRSEQLEEGISLLNSKNKDLKRALKNLLKDTKHSQVEKIQTLQKEYGSSVAMQTFLDQMLEREKAVEAQRTEVESQIQTWYNDALAKLKDWQKQQLKKEEAAWQEEEPELLKAREEAVKQAVADLWKYKDDAPRAKNLLLEVALIVGPMRTFDDKSFFTNEQKNWLIKEYRADLEKNYKVCGTNVNGEDPTCNLSIQAVQGLSLFSQDTYKDGSLIFQFMKAKYTTPYAVNAILAGTAALLAMQEYGLLESFIAAATLKENDLSDEDWFSIQTGAEALININGQYLGKVSKFGQYPLSTKAGSDGPQGNVWEDMAQIMAQEGSKRSLGILREFGVEKCHVRKDGEKYTMSCRGIRPFLVGALASGKSGAENYNVRPQYPAGTVVMSGNGRNHVVTDYEAKKEISVTNALNANFKKYAELMHVTPAAAVARHLFNQSMGDLNAENELRVDNLLYEKVWAPAAKKTKPLAKYAITNYDRESDIFHKKQLRQSRANVFRVASKIADIAILVWCLVDITKWGYAGSKIGYGLFKVARMARKGASVAERLTMLRKLKIDRKLVNLKNFKSNMAQRVAPAVLPQAPHFAMSAVAITDNSLHLGEAMAKGLSFSRETGELVLDAKTLRAEGVSPKMINDTRKALAGAAVKTNETFANTKVYFTKNHAYKNILLQNAKQALTFNSPLMRNDVERMLKGVKGLSIKVPANIGAFVKTAAEVATEEEKKKSVWPLMVVTGLSLSSASAGLIVPLENTYGNQITETDKMWITIGLPYIPSLLSSYIAPFTMKWGSLRVLQTALVTSTVGLTFAGAMGFYGNVDEQNLPPIWPLMVSGACIGVSSALSRASLNQLIKEMGGGGKLLQSMLFKNMGSTLLLLPPFLANFINKDIDFSLAFPVLGGLSLGSLVWITACKYDKAIGSIPGFMPFVKAGAGASFLDRTKVVGSNAWSLTSNVIKEGTSALRLLGTREIAPIVLATTFFTGFEAATLNKAGNQMFKNNVKDSWFVDIMPESNKKNATSLITTTALMLAPLTMRYFAPKLLNAIGSPVSEIAQYNRMLGISYAMNIAGAGLIYANGLQGPNAGWGLLGLGLVGLGTANVTQSFQNIAQLKVVRSNYVMKRAAGLGQAGLELQQSGAKTKMMTAFSTSQVGLAMTPMLVGTYTDRNVESDILTREEAPRNTLWIPLSFIGGSFALAAPTIFRMPSLPVGTLALTKGIVGSYPTAFKNSYQFGKESMQDLNWINKPSVIAPQGFQLAPEVKPLEPVSLDEDAVLDMPLSKPQPSKKFNLLWWK